MAIPVGPPQGARGQVLVTLRALVSMTFRTLRSSMLLYRRPLPLDTANSGPPPRSIVFTSSSVWISMTQVFLLSPLKTNTLLEDGSYTIASSSLDGRAMVLMILRVERSTTTTALDLPSLMKPLW